MATFNDTVRIYGEELDETDTFIDVRIEGYSISGDVKMVEDVEREPREWIVPQTNIADWQRKNVMISHEEMPHPDHEIWSVISSLQDLSSDPALAAAQSKIQDIVDTLFSESTRAQRSLGNGPDGNGPPGQN